MKKTISNATVAAFAAVCLSQPCLTRGQNSVTNGLVAHLKFEDNWLRTRFPPRCRWEVSTRMTCLGR